MNRPFHASKHQIKIAILGVMMAATVLSMVLVFVQSRRSTTEPREAPAVAAVKPTVEPQLETQTILDDLSHPWEVAFLPDGTLLFTERSGTLSAIVDGKKQQIAQIPDVYRVTESGLTGLAVDAEFNNNRFIYTCFNAQTTSGLDVRLVRWRLSEDKARLTDRRDIITSIPANPNGYHSGCRVKAASDGTLWVGTGDAYRGGVPQDPKSLGGKILHVTRDGMPTGSNLPAPFDPRIFSYGHRNVQGIMLYDQPTADGVYGLSIEHGSTVDDEVNLLKKGNFGWAPNRTYIQAGVPMTDLTRFPDAISAVWSSGQSTIAPSGGTIVNGEQWGTYNGSAIIAVLKARQLRLLTFNDAYQVIAEKAVLDDVGRVRTAVQGPDGNVYITTDNGADDMIIKVTPKV